jgi:putative heme iron utilization protein
MLTENDVNEIKQRRPPLVADEVASSLQQTVTQILALLPVESHARPEAASIPA